MDKKKIISIIVVIIILSCVGLSFAILAPKITSILSKTAGTSKNLSITYSEDNTISLTNFKIGDEVTKTITITNNTSNITKYDLVWENVINTFIDKDALVINATCVSSSGTCPTIEEQELPYSGNNFAIYKDIEIASLATHTYTFTYKYKNLDRAQLSETKTFNGKITAKYRGYKNTISYSNIDTSYNTNTLGKNVIDNNVLRTDLDMNTLPKNDDTITLNTTRSYISDGYYNLLSNEASTSVSGLYKVKGDNGYYTYVFRGITNNNITLGDLSGKIIRINEDGSIRVSLNTSVNTRYSDSQSALTYTYNNSIIKTDLNSWYITNLTQYDNLITYSYMCDNSTNVSFSNKDDYSWFISKNIGRKQLGVYNYSESSFPYNNTYLAPYNSYNTYDEFLLARILAYYNISSVNGINNVLESVLPDPNYLTQFKELLDDNPSFECNKSSDKNLEKIVMPTVEEALYSGISGSRVNPYYSYLNLTNTLLNGTNYLNGQKVFTLNEGKVLLSNSTSSYYNVTPIISLKRDVEITSGDGSTLTPYVVKVAG